MSRRLVAICTCVILAGAGVAWLTAAEHDPAAAALAVTARRLEPLAERLGAPQPGSWLAEHPEDGQSFSQWRRSRPNRPTAQRRHIDLVPIGDVPAARAPLFTAAEAFLTAFYQLPVRRLAALDLGAIPADAERFQHRPGQRQLRSTWLLDRLAARRGDDAVAVLGLTVIDLWPGEGWNFVFGQASLTERVGVWSVGRFGDPAVDGVLPLRRTVATAIHETGHQFGMAHCTVWRCVMNGSNHLDEADAAPLAACPDCCGKVWSLSGVAPAQQLDALAQLARKHGLVADAERWERQRTALAP